MIKTIPNARSIAFISLGALALAVTELAFAGGQIDYDLPSPLQDSDYLYDGKPPEPLVELGRNLFFDPILSGNRNISCGTCHDPALGSGDGLALGIGEGGDGAGAERITRDAVIGRVPRNAQPLWNIGARDYVSMFHDGRVERLGRGSRPKVFRSPAGGKLPEDLPNLLTAQAFFPVTSPIEMAGQFGENPVADAAAVEDREAVWEMLALRVSRLPAYFDLLSRAYQDLQVPGDVTFAHLAEALAAFQSVAFRSDGSPFDDVLRSGDASHLPKEAQVGMSLFYGKAGCAACHSGPLLTDHDFHAIGVPQIGPGKGHGSDLSYFHETGLPGRQEDEGSYRVTFDKRDLFAFRTPSLRNVELTGPWGHSGAFATLEAAIRHHLDPRESILGFSTANLELPELGQVLRMTGRGTHLGFAPLEKARRVNFDKRDTRVMKTPALRERLLRAVELDPVDLTDSEIAALVAFLKTLTDPNAKSSTIRIPSALPSGLQAQPKRPSKKGRTFHKPLADYWRKRTTNRGSRNRPHLTCVPYRMRWMAPAPPASDMPKCSCHRLLGKEPSMTVKTVGLDLARDVFQVQCVSATGRRIINKKFKRAKLIAFFQTLPRCVVGMEACGSAHHWVRELRKLGHGVRLMAAAYVKPYVKRGKTDAADAEAICEAVRRPTMRFVEIKSEDQQAVLAIHRARDLVVRQRTQVMNMIRGILREFGHILPSGIEAVSKFAREHGTEDQLEMPETANGILGVMCHQLNGLNARVDGLTKLIEQHAWLDADARRLMRMPGIGPITASAVVATIGDAKQFETGRDLAAWLGLTPMNKSSGGRERLGRITKKGDRYIRKLLIVGMTSRALMAKNSPEKADTRTAKLLDEKPFRLATVAMAD